MTDPNDVRRQFEAWAEAAGYSLSRTTGRYADYDTVNASLGYNAALQSPAVRELVEAHKLALATIDDYLAYKHDGDPWQEDARAMGEMDINDFANDGRLERCRTALRTLGAGHVECDDICDGHAESCHALSPGDRECNCHKIHGFNSLEEMEEMEAAAALAKGEGK